MSSKGEELKKLIEAPEILIQPGVFNCYSARLVESLGYKSAFITGGGVSESTIGWPDVGLMGMDDNLRVSKAMADCTDLLLMGDADTGYGNAVNVYFTVRAFEQAGLAGLLIEDQAWPKRCGHMPGKILISAEEMAEKIKAAVEARRDPAFVLQSRTDSAILGIDEVIRRLNLYAEAGADLLFADALLSVEDIETLVKNVSKPVAVNMGFGIQRRSTTPLLSPKQLEDLGVAVVWIPRLLTTAALRGMMNAMDALAESIRTGKVVERPDLQVTFEDLHDLMGLPELSALERRHLTPDQLADKYGVSSKK